MTEREERIGTKKPQSNLTPEERYGRRDIETPTTDRAEASAPRAQSTRSHPVGTGVGAAAGGVAGAGVGAALAGPIGAAAGAVAGAMAGGVGGSALSEHLDAEVEDAYWREHYRDRPYVLRNEPYELYSPAYRFGWQSRARREKGSFEEFESTLAREWSKIEANAAMTWDRARHAVRDAWDRVSESRAAQEGMGTARKQGARDADDCGCTGSRE